MNLSAFFAVLCVALAGNAFFAHAQSATTSAPVACSTLDPPKLDVFFIADTTGSMAAAHSSFKASEGDLVTKLLEAFPNGTHTGIGEHRDIYDSFTYRTNLALGAHSAATVSAATANWYAQGGGDAKEAQLVSLYKVARETPWRTGSGRIIVIITDVGAHNPRDGVSASMVENELNTKNIRVVIVDVSSYGRAGTLELTGPRIIRTTGSMSQTGAATKCGIVKAVAITQFPDTNGIPMIGDIKGSICLLSDCAGFLSAGAVSVGAVLAALVAIIAMML